MAWWQGSLSYTLILHQSPWHQHLDCEHHHLRHHYFCHHYFCHHPRFLSLLGFQGALWRTCSICGRPCGRPQQNWGRGFLYKLTLSRLLNIELWLFPLAIRTHLRRLLFVPDIMSGVHLCSLLWPLQTCCLWARLQVTSKLRNCQKVVRKIKLAYLNLETTLVCTQLTKCFSDYHYNEAYREGGGYICPAQVFKST